MLLLVLPTFTLTGSEFHRVGAATEEALVPAMGRKSGLKTDDRSCLGCLTSVSNERKHAGC